MTLHPPAHPSAQGTTARQRFGHITDHRPATGRPGNHLETYRVRDEETGTTYVFSDTDIVTEGLRTLRTGERVRFLIDDDRRRRASYVIRLDLPEPCEYYQ